MRLKSYLQDYEPEVIAASGHAQLVKHLNGKFELRGGTAEEQKDLREWAERFYPEIAATLPCPSDRRNK